MSRALTAAVVVCTSTEERTTLLRDCVNSLLAGQRKPDELFVVVDSNEWLASELNATLPPEVRLLHSERQGLSEARNMGVAAASSDVVAFVDDDATVDPDWLVSLLEAFASNPEMLGAGGPVAPMWDDDRRWMPDELLWVVGCTYRGHREDAGPIRNPIGCNMAFRREQLIAVGSFATSFGKQGEALATCDETELGLRIERVHGRDRIRYVPDARVRHFVPATRISWRLVVRRSLSEGLAKGRLHRLYRRAALGPERTYARRLLAGTVPRLLLKSVRRRDRSSAMAAVAISASLLITAVAFVTGTVRETRRQLLEHIRVPLHRDGYALALNSAFTAATGLVYWILAARSYSTHAVGLNSALISSMMFLVGIASLNLPNILVRFLPESGPRARPRVIWAYALSAGLAAVAAVVFMIGVGSWSPQLRFLHSDRGIQAWFLFSTLAWCLFVIQDSVLTALGRAIWVPVENAVFSVLKIVLLAVFAALLPVYGIFVSWTIAMLVSVIGVNVLIFGRLMRRGDGQLQDAVLSVRDRAFGRYFAADYVCSIAWLSTTNLMPVVVTAAVGATTNAYWALAYAVALPLYAVAQSIGTSLILHGAANRAALPELARKAAVQGCWVLIPSVALLVALAPVLLSLFGGQYAEHSATLLRLLAAGALPNFVLSLTVSVARVRRRLRRAVIALGTEAILALGLATPLLHAVGVAGAGIAWIGSQCLVSAGLLLASRGQLDFAGSMTDAEEPEQEAISARDRGQLRARAQPARDLVRAEELHPVLSLLFASLGRKRIRWSLLRVPSNPAAPTGDVDLLVAPADADVFREAAAEVGFVALPGWDSAPHLLLVSYDRPSDQWLLLDVSTTVDFRFPPSWRFEGAAEKVLQRSENKNGIVMPADGDAFWLLLLHCLLDKRIVAPHYRTTLRHLAYAGLDSPLGEAVSAMAGSTIAPEAFARAAGFGEWQTLTDLGVQLAAELKRHRPARQRLLALVVRVVRRARKPLLLRRRRGLTLALLGPNGVGKSTAAEGLHRSWPFESRVIYMGMWKEPANPRGRASYAIAIIARPLRLWSRYVRALYHQLRGRLVVFDRYVYEALLPAQPPFVAAKRAYLWFLAHAIPRARASVVLDVPGDVAYERKQENPPHELESERRIYAQITTRRQLLEMVDARADAETVRAELTAILWRELAARWSGARVRP